MSLQQLVTMSAELYTELNKNPDEGPRSMRHKAQIFLYKQYQHNTSLQCEVDIDKLNNSHPSYLKLQEFSIWEDMRSSSMTEKFGWWQVISCRIPEGMLPLVKDIELWVREVAKSNTSGVIGSFYGALLEYAMCYTKDSFRPLVIDMNLSCSGSILMTSSAA
jgi:hypothetical protein